VVTLNTAVAGGGQREGRGGRSSHRQWRWYRPRIGALTGAAAGSARG
jgi:hypothetical protein